MPRRIQAEADPNHNWRRIPGEHYSINELKQVRNDKTNLLLTPYYNGPRGAAMVDISQKPRSIAGIFRDMFPELQKTQTVSNINKKKRQLEQILRRI